MNDGDCGGTLLSAHPNCITNNQTTLVVRKQLPHHRSSFSIMNHWSSLNKWIVVDGVHFCNKLDSSLRPPLRGRPQCRCLVLARSNKPHTESKRSRVRFNRIVQGPKLSSEQNLVSTRLCDWWRLWLGGSEVELHIRNKNRSHRMAEGRKKRPLRQHHKTMLPHVALGLWRGVLLREAPRSNPPQIEAAVIASKGLQLQASFHHTGSRSGLLVSIAQPRHSKGVFERRGGKEKRALYISHACKIVPLETAGWPQMPVCKSSEK